MFLSKSPFFFFSLSVVLKVKWHNSWDREDNLLNIDHCNAVLKAIGY